MKFDKDLRIRGHWYSCHATAYLEGVENVGFKDADMIVENLSVIHQPENYDLDPYEIDESDPNWDDVYEAFKDEISEQMYEEYTKERS